MLKSCKSCGNFVECQGRNIACRPSVGKYFAWIPKESNTIDELFEKFIKSVNHQDWDKYTLMKFAFAAGIEFGKDITSRSK